MPATLFSLHVSSHTRPVEEKIKSLYKLSKTNFETPCISSHHRAMKRKKTQHPSPSQATNHLITIERKGKEKEERKKKSRPKHTTEDTRILDISLESHRLTLLLAFFLSFFLAFPSSLFRLTTTK